MRARAFSKWVRAHAVAKREGISAVSALEGVAGVETLRKAAVDAQTTGNSSALLSESRPFASLLARQTVLGRLAGTVPAPPNTPIPTPDTDPEPSWVVEGNPIPLGSIDFSAPRSSISKFGIILAITDELMRTADDRGISLIERVTVRSLVHGEDALLLSDTAAVAQGNPAGLLFELTATGGGSPSTLADDFSDLWTAVEDGDPDRPYFVLSPRAAMYLATLNTDGTPLFPNISPATGGSLFGVPAILSKAAGANVILIDASRIAVTDEGVEILPSRQSSIQMVNTPTPGVTSVVSMFMTNTAALRLLRYVHWTKLSDASVAFLTLPIAGSPS